MSETDTLIGQTIDNKYEILELLGKGAMGAVYKAEHRLMNRTVALKVLNVEHLGKDAETEEFLSRFEREARTASKIKHPSAITIHDFGFDSFGKEGRHPYLVMEYIEGKTLKAVFNEEEVSPERIVRILNQIAGALDEAHSRGIVHRDIKTENIMISKRSNGSDWAHVLDFGIAKVLAAEEGEESAELTKPGMIVGSPKYMSPEQVLNRTLDARSDIYSLGVILYEYFSGKAPFEAKSVMEFAFAQVNESPIPLSERNPGKKISKDVEQVVMKALAKDPDNRQQTAGQLSNELARAYSINVSSSANLVAFHAPKRRAVPLAAVGVVAVMLAVLGYSNFEKPQASPKVSSSEADVAERIKKVEQSVAEAQKRAAAAELKATSLSTKAQELELWKTAQEAEEVLREKAEQEAEEAKRKAAEAEKKMHAVLKQIEKERNKAGTSSKNSKLAKARESEAQQQLRAAKLKAAEAERKAREAEARAQAAEEKRLAAAKRVEKAQEKEKVESSAIPATTPVEKRKRRRCGPTWCD